MYLQYLQVNMVTFPNINNIWHAGHIPLCESEAYVYP